MHLGEINGEFNADQKKKKLDTKKIFEKKFKIHTIWARPVVNMDK